MAVPVSFRPLSLAAIRANPWRVVFLFVSLLAFVGSFAVAALRQPWRDLLGGALTAEIFAFGCAWTKWTRESSAAITDK